MKMFVAGEWVAGDGAIEVRHPYDGRVIETVPKASPADVERALASAVRGAAVMRAMPGHERYRVLHRAAELMRARQDELGRLISLEEGKVLAKRYLASAK